jgi:hypothetical protein
VHLAARVRTWLGQEAGDAEQTRQISEGAPEGAAKSAALPDRVASILASLTPEERARLAELLRRDASG